MATLLPKKAVEIVKNVVKVCKEEKKKGGTCLPVSQAIDRASHYTGMSNSTCRKLAKLSVAAPRKPRKKRSDKIFVDCFDKEVIRRTVFDLIERKIAVTTLNSIMTAVKERIHFPYSKSTLRRLLREIGFVWKRCSSNRLILMERNDVAVARINYLRKIKGFREAGRPIVYTDETYVHTTHSTKMCWQSADSNLKIPFSRGERLIVVHAGTDSGFIPGAKLVFRAKSTTGDYHHEMNSENFYKWLTTQLIPNLPPRSVVVVDNASYHTIQIDKCPTSSNTKSQIVEWLDRNDIPYNQGMLKIELLDVCKRMKPAPRYKLDETLLKYGHECLRLPQYHAELNAIELIWSQVKGKIARENLTYTRKNVEKLTSDALDSITAQEWTGCCRHVQTVEQRFWDSNVAVERAIDSFIIQVSDEEGTDTADEVDSYSDTDSAWETDVEK